MVYLNLAKSMTDKINQLLSRLENLEAKQAHFSNDIVRIKEEIHLLKNEANKEKAPLPPKEEIVESTTESDNIKETLPFDKVYLREDWKATTKDTVQDQAKDASQFQAKPKPSNLPRKSSWEKFIGENLINKVGIIITIIGVAIGAKYSIEKGLISPLTRIIIGYLVGVGLLGFGMKLKANYLSYSSVLVSGAMTIFYFITFLAYSLYGIIPQPFAFGLMVLFTAFTVFSAINYDKKIIAQLGLVGAYAVPFLLSTGSGRIDILLSYITIINIGILIVSVMKYWRPIFYSSFVLSWLIYAISILPSYTSSEDFGLAFTFLTLFFLIFYITFIAFKLRNQQKFGRSDVIMLLANSFIFYGIGYILLEDSSSTSSWTGFFTLINAGIHFAVCTIIYKQKLADKRLFYLIAGLVLVFITIAIPVQLDGNWVTLLWIGEAALLFWIGKTNNILSYEKLAYPLIALASLSIIQDWSLFYENAMSGRDVVESFTTIFNIQFLSSILFIGALGFIVYMKMQHKANEHDEKSNLVTVAAYAIVPALFVAAIYMSFFLEISSYFGQLLAGSTITVPNDYGNMRDFRNMDFRDLRTVWLILYSMCFVAILAFFNMVKLKNTQLGKIILGLSLVVIFSFLSLGLYALSELREHYIEDLMGQYFNHGWFNIGIRYLSLTVFAGFIYLVYRFIKQPFLKANYKQLFEVVLHVSILWVTSSELLSIMNFSGHTHNYKLALSILWGLYSLIVIAYGIWKDNAFLRIGAIGLFALTLIKLFLYDISHLNTIAKTIVFVSLGVLLLIISFLYNKYKHKITYYED